LSACTVRTLVGGTCQIIPSLPAVKLVTTISSNDSANASNPPASNAERTNGSVT